MSYNKGAEATGGLNRSCFCMLFCCDAHMYAAGDVPDGVCACVVETQGGGHCNVIDNLPAGQSKEKQVIKVAWRDASNPIEKACNSGETSLPISLKTWLGGVS